MPRAAKPTGKSRHDPLHVQLDEDQLHAKYGRVSQPGKRKKSRKSDGHEEDSGEVILDPKTSRKIFELARDQQDELEMPDDENEVEADNNALSQPRMPTSDDEDEELDEEDVEEIEMDAEELAALRIDSGDQATLDALLPPNAGERRTLADIIFAKLDGGGETDNTISVRKTRPGADDRAPDPAEGLDPKVVEAYTKVGFLLQKGKYKSGPLPKLFKIIPSLPGWARLLALTHPESWSPHACFAATRVFISNMKPVQARIFLEGVVLDAVREDIRENASGARLNVHYYACLKKALYKPAAFFKGIVFPLLDSGCTLKEAAIIASVLAKVKVPILHSSAAIMRLAEMDYSGPNSLFIRILLDKKYALPYKVVDALVFHFIRLSNTHSTQKSLQPLPVLWHQSLLVFAQRYASDLTPEQKDALLDVVRASPHSQIGPEIRRELVSSVARGEPVPGPGAGVDVEMG